MGAQADGFGFVEKLAVHALFPVRQANLATLIFSQMVKEST
jgi:hypothetical protein